MKGPQAMSAYLPHVPIDDLVLIVSMLFEKPDRSGPLANLRRESGAKHVETLRAYIAAAPLTRAERRALSADLKARAATADDDYVRMSMARFLIETGAGADLGFSDADLHDMLD